MSRSTKTHHPAFIEYGEMIIEHPNYEGLPIDHKVDGTFTWVAPKESITGRKRLEWADDKISERGITGEAPYAKLMFELHPTKSRPCQTCGKRMSLMYIYPNSSLIKAISREFEIEIDDCTPIDTIFDRMVEVSNELKVKRFFIKKFKLDPILEKRTKEDLLNVCERACRVNRSNKFMGPGAMSNFPDRFDGFHSYNRCCRSTEDKGRSVDNMRTYTKDRRAYEYWSDGNIHSANKFMKSNYFSNYSADHVGPISLGFIHDSIVLRRMSGGDNSSKRDKLRVEDIIKLIEIEERTGQSVINRYSFKIWEHIKSSYKSNENLERYRLMLKQNLTNYMYVLLQIKETGPTGVEFFETYFFRPKMQFFEYNYKWDEEGNIISRSPRTKNDANREEYLRLKRVAIESIDDYFDKDNRHTDPNLSNQELLEIRAICDLIKEKQFDSAYSKMNTLVEAIQNRLISN